MRNTCVANVGGVFHPWVVYVIIGMFIQASISAQNVENALEASQHLQDTFEDIQERNHLNAMFVANGLQRLQLF